MALKKITRTANKAVRRARRELRRRFPNLVGTVFWYGAVDIDPKHLVVWVMLKGPADELPKWFFPNGDSSDEADAKGWLPEIAAATASIRRAFAEAGWPRDSIDIGFDSDERVEQEGGYLYFK